MLSPLVAGTASASSSGSAATVSDVTPQARHLVCAQSLTLRFWPGGPKNGDVLHLHDLVETLQWEGAWVLVDPIQPDFDPGWVVGSYLC
jgi:hypothetical protein